VLFFFVLYSLCCQFLWIVHFWLPLRNVSNVCLRHFSMLSSVSQCLCVCYSNCFDKRIQIISYRLPSLYSWHNLLFCLHWNTSYLRNVQVKQKKTVKTLKNQICYKYLSEKIVLLFIDICQYYQVGDTSWNHCFLFGHMGCYLFICILCLQLKGRYVRIQWPVRHVLSSLCPPIITWN
jgi:hypothetical protein